MQNRQNKKKTYTLHFSGGWVYQKVIRNNWVDPFVFKTKFRANQNQLYRKQIQIKLSGITGLTLLFVKPGFRAIQNQFWSFEESEMGSISL